MTRKETPKVKTEEDKRNDIRMYAMVLADEMDGHYNTYKKSMYLEIIEYLKDRKILEDKRR